MPVVYHKVISKNQKKGVTFGVDPAAKGKKDVLGAIIHYTGEPVKPLSVMANLKAMDHKNHPVQTIASNPLVLDPKDPSIAKSVVPLCEADELYQPVRGTSSQSVYTVVGITKNEDLKIAARVNGHQLSVRVEGKISRYKKQLSNCGIGTKNFSKGYTSMHVSIGSIGLPPEVVVSRTIGSILSGLCMPMKTEFPDCKILMK